MIAERRGERKGSSEERRNVKTKEKRGQPCESEEGIEEERNRRERERGEEEEEEKPQGRLSLFVFPLPSAGQTVTRKTEGRVGEEGEMENN